MLIKTMYVRFYKSFNYDYLRKYKLNREDGEPWDAAPGSGRRRRPAPHLDVMQLQSPPTSTTFISYA
ncbi:protein of unknown function [Micropruina glycogenica]|jgi:hypothetical protein|uniref:Uncharacterized protein n=1 Tax=Micropruina glycogenica TaxID=75385 RepID=A0A2N9JL94_9ACTN|nr:protein of unknown function [Micropruina glycogenica]